MSNDLVLCAYNCSSTSPCSKWIASLFTKPPQLFAVPGNSSTAFKNIGMEMGKDIDKWLERNGYDSPNRLAVVTFSAGWGFVDSLLRSKQWELIDTIILIDGLHCNLNQLDPWVRFAKRAACGGGNMPMLIMAHSNIIPPYTSAKATNSTVFTRGLGECLNAGDESEEPLGVTQFEIGADIHISSQYGGRTWTKDPIKCWEGAGNLYRFEFNGGDAPTHIYLAKHVQPRLWQMLAERWNIPTNGVNSCVEG